VTLSMLRVEDGAATADPRGGAILNAGALLLDRVSIEGNRADDGAGNGAGGGVYNLGTLTVNASTIMANAISPAAAATGGGIHHVGTMTLLNSTVMYNCGLGDESQGRGAGIV